MNSRPDVVEGKRDMLRVMWRDRLMCVRKSVDVWQALLSVRSLVLPMNEDAGTYLKWAALCRKTGREKLAHDVLLQLLGYDPASVKDQNDPRYCCEGDDPRIG